LIEAAACCRRAATVALTDKATGKAGAI